MSTNGLSCKVLKSSPSLFAGWQERWLELKDRKLSYYKNKGDKVPQGVLNFDLFMCSVEDGAKDTDFKLIISGQTRTFEFRCQDTFTK
jgi:hypothetical protein